MNSDAKIGGIGKRLRLALGNESVNGFAKRCGIGEGSVRQYLAGSTPGLDKAMAMARALRVRLEWLATGDGPMEEGAGVKPAPMEETPPLDAELFGRIIDGITKVYKETGVRLPPVELGRMAARMATELANVYEDPDDRPVGLKALLNRLREDLMKAPSANDTETKRQA